MMANHSEEFPEGYLDKETFKSFFAVSGSSGSFTYQRGYERIPDNWYRRPLSDPYTIAEYVTTSLHSFLPSLSSSLNPKAMPGMLEC